MKLLKTFIGISSISIIPLPNAFSILNYQNNNHKDEQKIEILELDSFKNLFKNITTMVENNSFWNVKELEFNYWKDGTDSVKKYFESYEREIYLKYFDNQTSALFPLKADMTEEKELLTFKANFVNDSPNEQKWTTPGYQEKVINDYSYTVISRATAELGLKISLKWMGNGTEGSYSIKTGTEKKSTTGKRVEKTEISPPELVSVKPHSMGTAIYRITQGHGVYKGKLSAINTPPFNLKIPPFISKSGKEVKIVLTAKDLLKGLEKEGYNLRLIGNGSTKFSVISYDDTKPIEEVDTVSFNMPIEWNADISRIFVTYEEISI